MREADNSRRPKAPTATAKTSSLREIVVAHDPLAGPVRAIKNVIIQFSLAQLKENNHYDQYVELIAPEVLEDLLARLGPGWIPVKLALAHYAACEKLGVSERELKSSGTRVGDRLQETSLVTVAKKVRDADFDLWSAEASLHRMWARLYQGGSVQVTKLGPREKLIELRGFPMVRYAYFRRGLPAAIAASHAALGAEFSHLDIESYNPESEEVALRLKWL